MKKIAVIGSNGFVGSEICKEIEKSDIFSVLGVTRDDSLKDGINMADIVIHSANSGKRFFAEKNPEKVLGWLTIQYEELVSVCTN